MSSWVLDASALMALLYAEPGLDRVVAAVGAGAAVSTVNLSEVIAKLADRGAPEREIRDTIETIGLDITEFDADDALAAGLLRPATRAAGLSLGDRACLALAQLSGAPVLTADRAWAAIELDGVEVQFIR
ncbi:MAG: type II toxin-antitoxin system VapC family toxin [Chloroflexi bacterium]|nr:type II toxin-antitoxin system VapC family toxin [Chloroflexota bacterium]MYE45183.1 type II toxin-antitoxin system VapC family toxin [Chloroflexota bacterium]